MEWKKDKCIYCKKEIVSPKEAIYMFSLQGDRFAHFVCYANRVLMHAGAIKKIEPGVALTSGIITARGVSNAMEDIEYKYGKPTREKMQKSISDTDNIRIVAGLFFAILVSFAALKFQTIKLDAIGWLAVAILGVLAVVMLYASVMYRLNLRKFEELLK